MVVIWQIQTSQFVIFPFRISHLLLNFHQTFNQEIGTIDLLIRHIGMNLKPLYKSQNNILIGLKSDFRELCVIDGLVVEVDIEGKRILSEPVSGLQKLKAGSYTPIRQQEKKEYARMIERKLKRKTLKKIEEKLVDPPKQSVESLAWIPERLGGHGDL